MNTVLKIALALIALMSIGTLLLWLLRGQLVEGASPAPKTLGMQDGRLVACPPNSMNCVSSYNAEASTGMAALTFEGSAADAQAKLLQSLASLGNATVVTQQPGYVHAITRTPMWGFIDDLQFFIADGKIQFKAQARLGRGDMGMNRARMEKITALMKP